MLPIRAILHPTDFSDYSEHALKMACALARDHGARVIVAHVRAVPVPVYSEIGPLIPDPIESPADLKRRLENLVPASARVAVETVLLEGEPAEAIVDLAEDSGADLIVMGTHGRTGLGRLLMGSVAELVLRKAPCPVMTLKAPFPPAMAEERPSAVACA